MYHLLLLPLQLDRFDSIIFDNNTNQIFLEFSVPRFTDQENLLIQYKLDNQPWSLIKNEELLGLNLYNLSSGWHELIIRKRTGFDTNDFAYTKVAIYIDKKYYEKWWFIPVLLLGLTGIIWMTVLLSNKNLQRKKKQLQKQVDLQTKELKKALNTKETLISVVSHDMIAPLKFVSYITDILGKGIEKDPQKINDALTDIKKTTDKVLSDSLNIISWIKYSSGKIKTERQSIDLYSLTEEIIQLFSPLANKKGINLYSTINNTVAIESDPNIIKVIISNLVSNAVKNTNEGYIEISFSHTDSEEILTIKDTGSGISKNKLKRIHEVLKGNFMQANNEAISTGLGYLIIGRLISVIKAKIVIDSTPERGTEVKIISSVK
ncbi:HAMP domain-containing histidine kinase [Ferruginibacter lapsinanis]|uniref:sensor histidine kinase n=1 Tax=Ferruginibacter lapsinanis TaxID=563172 RepID=UPI001E5217E2|nr:HAMP domain-containing sensor histidine kinase [Ferruginibacter lapsinanis]UEG48659.1 HAMP domain-containing histidine kinase [Ferruginibacter lapsinanis]